MVFAYTRFYINTTDYTDAKMLETMHRDSSHIVSGAHFFDPGHRIVSFYAGASMPTGESSHP